MSRPSTANRFERILANLVDVMAVNLLPALLSALIMPEHGIWLILSFLYCAAYFAYFTASDWQASPGQRLLGIHITRHDGRRMDARAALERFLAFYIPQLPMYSSALSLETVRNMTLWLAIVWFLPICVRQDRRGVHDLLSGSQAMAGKK